MTKPNSEFRVPHFAYVAVIAILTFFSYFLGLNLPLLGPDEPRYAQVAREMFERGDWVTPTLAGHHWFEKPALLYWLEIAAFKVFGVTEFSARLGPALFGIGTIAAIYLLGRVTEGTDLHDGSKGQSVTRSAVFAIIAASTLGIVAFSHGASFDIILTLPLTASLVAFFVFDQRSSALDKTGNKSSALFPLLLFYFFIGVATLAKGLVGIVFPFAIVAFYHLMSRKWPSRTLMLSIFWGSLLSITVAASWYLPMYLRHGYGFIDEFFVQHHFQRFTSNKYQHPQAFYFFFWMLPVLSIPWFPFALASIWRAIKSAINGQKPSDDATDHDKPLLLFALSWLLVPLVFFSFSGSKLPGYIMPSVPAMAILAGSFLTRFVNRSERRTVAVFGVAAASLLIYIGILVGYMPVFAKSDSVKYLIAAANEANLADGPILCLHTVPHNAEFYAAGRLIRESDGKIKRFGSSIEVADFIRDAHIAEAVVLVPPQSVEQLTAEGMLISEKIAQNDELVVFKIRHVDSSGGRTP